MIDTPLRYLDFEPCSEFPFLDKLYFFAFWSRLRTRKSILQLWAKFTREYASMLTWHFTTNKYSWRTNSMAAWPNALNLPSGHVNLPVYSGKKKSLRYQNDSDCVMDWENILSRQIEKEAKGMRFFIQIVHLQNQNLSHNILPEQGLPLVTYQVLPGRYHHCITYNLTSIHHFWTF